MQMELGQVVRSLAGRDKGKPYLIIDFMAGGRVLLVDGRIRTVNKPKKKNIKHLQPYRCVIPGIKERIRLGNLNDKAVRNALNTIFPVEDKEYNPPCLRISSSNE